MPLSFYCTWDIEFCPSLGRSYCWFRLRTSCKSLALFGIFGTYVFVRIWIHSRLVLCMQRSYAGYNTFKIQRPPWVELETSTEKFWPQCLIFYFIPDQENKHTFKRNDSPIKFITSVSKKSGQTAVVIQYYSLSRFFWNRHYN